MINVQRGEQPLKRVPVRRTLESTLGPDDMGAADDDNAGTALYAPYQTSLYVAPPVINGQIPKNGYGNLDVYVPSMVPPGGIHISHPDTARAARIVGIDYADAVTGFSFKGRHGTAITSGAVVAVEYREAVQEVIKAFEDERVQAEEERRSLEALKTWKRFLAGLRIRQRIESYEIEGERDTAVDYEMEKDEDEDEDERGGFLPDRDAHGPAQPTVKAMPTRNLPRLGNDDEGGGFLASEDEQEEIEAPDAFDHFVNRVNDDDDNDDGGFLLDHDDQDAEEAIREINEDDHQNPTHEDRKAPAGHISLENDGQGILDQGGGFLPDDDYTGNEAPPADDLLKPSGPFGSILADHSGIDSRDILQNTKRSEEFPDLPEGELEEAKMSQQLYESQGSEHLPISKGIVSATARRDSSPPPMLETATGGELGMSAHPNEVYPNNEPVAEENSEPDSSEEDRGSLLSHDPDDEDADPEWLA